MIMVTPFGHCPVERLDDAEEPPLRRRGDVRTDRRPVVPLRHRP